ncbi:GNAT family N-acetyltransferase [Deinococcus sp. QL22]|uniref:GNAT family N-acetyltransferase n=1 Tax=Deinococcus sp. QL22 TaxID=2939437 RepID=UPI002017125C|nr:GNAT family N-acetyltransferase [Deinococcus sp. QL22]UQN07281.1 GNAT family N-acetyltransferase [Deinococcus sp. QL22]
MTYTLRQVTRAEVPTFHTVMMAAGMDARSSWSRTTVADLEHSLFGVGAGGLLAWAGAEAVGCVGFRPDGSHTLTLNKLATLPQARGHGIGAALVQAVEELAVQQGYGRVLLAVSQFNLDVIPFYERLGYRQDSAAVYAHASPQSPAPVVLVKAVMPITTEVLL